MRIDPDAFWVRFERDGIAHMVRAVCIEALAIDTGRGPYRIVRVAEPDEDRAHGRWADDGGRA